MSPQDTTNIGPKGAAAGNSSDATSKKVVTAERDISDEVGGISLKDHDKTPTQGDISNGTLGESDSDSAATPIQTSANPATPGAGLVRKSASSITLRASDADDVFAPSIESTSGPESYHAITPTVVEPTTVSDHIRAGYLSIVPSSTCAGYAPRADRGTEVNVHNAQGMWPPEAVVFVANLSAQRTHDQLEYACHQIFDVFGRNIIKVKFDKNKHPFALVQYENPESAVEAITNNQGAILDNRTIRLEQGKAERAVILTMNNGAPFSEGDARALLEQFGAVDAIYPTYALRGRTSTLPGFYVRFAYYQDCRDALKTLSGIESAWRLQLATGAEQDCRPAVGSAPSAPSRHGAPHPVGPNNTDSKSVFVGNLPVGTSKQDLVDLFAAHGQIIDVNVITKRYEGGSVNVFGFVEYGNGAEAEHAAYTEKWLGGKKLRTEPKEYTARRGNRINQGVAAVAPTPERSPRRTPRRVTPQATNALTARLAANNVENFGSIYTPGPTPPQHLLPSNLFSPSPPSYWPMGAAYGGSYFDEYGNAAPYGTGV